MSALSSPLSSVSSTSLVLLSLPTPVSSSRHKALRSLCTLTPNLALLCLRGGSHTPPCARPAPSTCPAQTEAGRTAPSFRLPRQRPRRFCGSLPTFHPLLSPAFLPTLYVITNKCCGFHHERGSRIQFAVAACVLAALLASARSLTAAAVALRPKLKLAAFLLFHSEPKLKCLQEPVGFCSISCPPSPLCPSVSLSLSLLPPPFWLSGPF